MVRKRYEENGYKTDAFNQKMTGGATDCPIHTAQKLMRAPDTKNESKMEKILKEMYFY
jgi:hypothetical protein